MALFLSLFHLKDKGVWSSYESKHAKDNMYVFITINQWIHSNVQTKFFYS